MTHAFAFVCFLCATARTGSASNTSIAIKLEFLHVEVMMTKMYYTVNISTVLSTAFGSVTRATVIWLHILQPKIAIDLKLYSSVSLNVMCTVIACNSHCQITVAQVTQPMTVN